MRPIEMVGGGGAVATGDAAVTMGAMGGTSKNIGR